MTDEVLRATERALVTEPADLELRRRHARLLQRAGQAERALSALDLAWRLGADEVFDELRAALDARAVRAGPLELRYVPAGPFVMGSDDRDDDAAPAHLVELSAFYLSRRPVGYASLRGTPSWSAWMVNFGAGVYPSWRLDVAIQLLEQVCAGPLRAQLPPGQRGLPSEAQWERVHRARLQRSDGQGPYGVESGERPEWMADRYAPDAYAGGPRRDPPGPPEGELQVVRGVLLAPPDDVLYREAATVDGSFLVDRRARSRGSSRRQAASVEPVAARHEEGLAFRLCLVPERAA